MHITTTQNKILHGLLNSTGLAARKADLVAAFTEGRSESSKDLTIMEATELINHLKSCNNKTDAANQMRRKILAMCHRLQWTSPLTPGGGTPRVDMERLNNWCLQSSYLKKALNDYTYEELPKLVSQFQTVYRSYIKEVANPRGI